MAISFEHKRKNILKMLYELADLLNCYQTLPDKVANNSPDELIDFHFDMMNKVSARIADFLKYLQNRTDSQILSKRWDRRKEKTIFKISVAKNPTLELPADEIIQNKQLLTQLDTQDICDIAFTLGAESIVKEQVCIKSLKVARCS